MENHVREQISYLYRSGSSAEDVECAATMERLLAVYEAAGDVRFMGYANDCDCNTCAPVTKFIEALNLVQTRRQGYCVETGEPCDCERPNPVCAARVPERQRGDDDG